jgi:hypothetical protein
MGTLKLDLKAGRMSFETWQSSSEVSWWYLSDLYKSRLRTTLGGQRHFIELSFKRHIDNSHTKETFQMRSREDIEQLANDLRTAEQMTIDDPTTTANDQPLNERRQINKEGTVDQLMASAATNYDIDQRTSKANPHSEGWPRSYGPQYRGGGYAPEKSGDFPTASVTHIDVEVSLPVITDVIVLPDEQSMRDAHEAAAEPDIEISPFSERDGSSLHFWNREGHAKLKRGDKLQDDGCPSFYFIFTYLLTCSMIACLINYSFINTTDWSFSGFVFLAPTIIAYIFFQLNACGGCTGCCADNTLQYLQNAKASSEVETLMKGYICDSRPKVFLNVRCWHTESSTDSDGNSSSRTVITYNQDYDVPVLSYGDCTEVANGDINLHEFVLTKVKLQQSLVPDQNLLDRKKQLYEHNRHRDKYCEVTEQMDLPDFIPHILCIAAGKKKPYLLNPKAYLIAHMLVLPALPFRLWMGCITGKVRLDIRKQITTEPVTEV